MTASRFLVELIVLSGASAASKKRHGLSLFGDLKYPPGFEHFESVNTDAPKGWSQYGWLGETVELADDYARRSSTCAPSHAGMTPGRSRPRDAVFAFNQIKTHGDHARNVSYRDVIEAVKTSPRKWSEGP